MKRVLPARALAPGFGDGRVRTNGDGGERDADDTGQRVEHEHPPDLALVFAYDYHSNALFRPIDRLPQGTVKAILGHRVDEGGPVVSEPTDYNGYVVLVKPIPNAPGEYAFVFVNEETLREEQWYRFTDDVVFFDTRVGLLSVALATGGGTEVTTVEEETTTEETTTEETIATNAKTITKTSETTTHEVIVETTETNDGK